MITNLDGIEATIECGDASIQELRGVIDYARSLLARAEKAEAELAAVTPSYVYLDGRLSDVLRERGYALGRAESAEAKCAILDSALAQVADNLEGESPENRDALVLCLKQIANSALDEARRAQ